ncbi:unnamed protein product, partial [Rhizoctonia solani]
AHHHGELDDNDASDYSQEDDVHLPSSRYDRSGYRGTYTTTSMHTRPKLSGDKPSGIPRPGSQNSRPSSDMKVPKSRPYNSSSSTDSSATSENIPPVPQISQVRARSRTPRIGYDSYSAPNDYPQDRPQSGLSRRASVSRPHSRAYSKAGYMDTEDPPPLPSSNSDSDNARVMEQIPKRASWAKDRRRFASATPTSTCDFKDEEPESLVVGEGDSRCDHPPTPVAAARRSSLKPPSNIKRPITPTTAPAVSSRIPSISAKPGRGDTKGRASLEHGTGPRSNSRRDAPVGVNGAEDLKTSQGPPQREPSQTRVSRTVNTLRSEPAKQVPAGLDSAGAPARPSSRLNSAHPKAASDKREQVTISSKHDAQLPASPFAPSDAISGYRTPRQDGTEEVKQPGAISSPVETMLIGSAPASQATKTPNSRRVSTPIRPTRETLTHVPPTPATSSALKRRLSEPSPNKATPSAKSQSLTGQEPPPTILQRIARRASLSTGKSPKITSTSKSPKASTTPKTGSGANHGVEDPPFDPDLDTPRATTSIGKNTGTSSAYQDSSDRHKNRQSSTFQSAIYSGPTGDELRKPRPKVVEEVLGSNEKQLGSPFMGDGSPRFGIDERFRSPKQRTTSNLRYDTFMPIDDRSQELLDYYGHGIVEPANTANYYIEGLPIGTVVSSPGRVPVDKTPKGTMPSSPMTQSKKRSQYQYSSRTRPSAVGSGTKQKGPDDLAKPLDDDSDRCSPTSRAQPRSSSFIPPPIITRTSVTSLDTSTRSEFSDASDQESGDWNDLRAGVYQEEAGSGKDYSGRKTPTLVRFAPQFTQSEIDQQVGQKTSAAVHAGPSNDKSKPGATSLGAIPRQHGNRASQLPVPRQQKTNSALFRALEQPYDSSSSATIASLGPSSMTGELNSDSEVKASSDYSTITSDGLHAVSSISSSLDGNSVGDIRWSGAQELSGAAEALFHNIERSRSGHGVQPNITSPDDESQSDIIDGSAYDAGRTDEDHGSRSASPLRRSTGQRQEGYDQRRMSMQDKRKAIHESWRASLEHDQLQRLEETYDPLELHRQELIWEFYESEREFVDTLRVLVHLFIQPLRTQDQRHWIAGLSPEIMRLFDWVDDITNLHEQLLDALETMRQDHEEVIILFSEALQPFIPLMELYQPYIIRVEATSKQVASMVHDPQSNFGEFVRIQSTLPECELALEEMIRRPVLRIREYVSFLQTLLTLTPRAHPDYFSCFSLLHAMHAIVCVLDEVKAREEEYELVKSLLSRVNGLPPQFTTATRENRLLAQGPLTRVHFRGDTQSRGNVISASRKSGQFTIGESRARSGSQSTSSATTESTSSYRSTSSSNTRFKDSLTEYSMRSDSSATVSYEDHQNNRQWVAAPGSRISRLRPRTPNPDQVEEIEIYALVFSEYVILSKGVVGNRRPKGPWKHPNEQWSTLEALGVFQLLGITDYRGRYGKSLFYP